MSASDKHAASSEVMASMPSLLMHIIRVPESVDHVSIPWLAPQPEGKAGPCVALAATSYNCTTPLLLQAAASSLAPPLAEVSVSALLHAHAVDGREAKCDADDVLVRCGTCNPRHGFDAVLSALQNNRVRGAQ